MKIKLEILDLSTSYDLEDDEIVNYDDYPSIKQIFYTIDSIYPVNPKYSAVISGGLEYITPTPISKLESQIDKAQKIIITDN